MSYYSWQWGKRDWTTGLSSFLWVKESHQRHYCDSSKSKQYASHSTSVTAKKGEKNPHFSDVKTEALSSKLKFPNLANEWWSWDSNPGLSPRCAHNTYASTKNLKRGCSHCLPVSVFPLGGHLCSTTNLLCDLRQIVFPLWALVFPPGKQSLCRPFRWPPSSFWYFQQASNKYFPAPVLHSRLGAHSAM